MSDYRSVTWPCTNIVETPEPGRVLVSGLVTLLLRKVTWPGYLGLGALYLFSLPLWWDLPLLLPHLFIVVTTALNALTSALIWSRTPHMMHVTFEGILLHCWGSSRRVRLDNLTDISVEHRTDEPVDPASNGSPRTSLRLEWSIRSGTSEMTLIGPFKPELAPALTQLLDRRVSETWRA